MGDILNTASASRARHFVDYLTSPQIMEGWEGIVGCSPKEVTDFAGDF